MLSSLFPWFRQADAAQDKNDRNDKGNGKLDVRVLKNDRDNVFISSKVGYFGGSEPKIWLASGRSRQYHSEVYGNISVLFCSFGIQTGCRRNQPFWILALSSGVFYNRNQIGTLIE